MLNNHMQTAEQADWRRAFVSSRQGIVMQAGLATSVDAPELTVTHDVQVQQFAVRTRVSVFTVGCHQAAVADHCCNRILLTFRQNILVGRSSCGSGAIFCLLQRCLARLHLLRFKKIYLQGLVQRRTFSSA